MKDSVASFAKLSVTPEVLRETNSETLPVRDWIREVGPDTV